MDFGNILDQWEKHKPENTKKKAAPAARAEHPKPLRVNPMDEWLRRNEIIDKDAQAREAGVNSAEQRRRLRRKKPDAVIDIHGLTRDEAWDALEQFFTAARARNLEKVLIIHGKGNHSSGEAVLKNMTKQFIERCVHAGESGQGTEGGSGATWVIVK